MRALRLRTRCLKLEDGTKTRSLSHLMGHSSTRTVQRYVSNTFAHYQDEVDALAVRLGGRVQSGEKKTEVGGAASGAGAEVGQMLPPESPPKKTTYNRKL